MENKSHAFAAGAFVLGLVAALVALIVWFTRDDTVRHVYELSTRDPVSGLQPQAAVRYRGIAVGKVTSIDFDPAHKGNVRVRLSVDEAVPLTRSTYATLSYQGVTGLAFIALDDKGDSPDSQEALVPIDDDPPRIPLRPSALAQLQDRGEVIIKQVETVTTRLSELLGDDNQQRVAQALENIARTSESANQLTRQLDSTIQNRLEPALAAIPPLAGNVNTALASVKTAAADVSRVANNFNGTVTRLNAPDGPIDRLASGTQALSQGMDSFNGATLPRLNRVADEAALTMRRLGRVADGLNENPQSLLFGRGATQPGPGEAGFTPPAATPTAAPQP